MVPFLLTVSASEVSPIRFETFLLDKCSQSEVLHYTRPHCSVQARTFTVHSGHIVRIRRHIDVTKSTICFKSLGSFSSFSMMTYSFKLDTNYTKQEAVKI